MAALITKVLLNPFVTGPFWALQNYTPLESLLQKQASLPLTDRMNSILAWLTVLGGARSLSAYLSELAQNNFRISSEASKYDWPNEIAVITGGTGGFGSLMAKGLAEKGVKVIAVDIRESLPKEMESIPKIEYYKCDITDPEAVKAMADDIKTKHGDPSILINNAGVNIDGTILNIPPAKVQQVFGVNILSHYYMCQQFLPAMCKNKKGHVVSLASMASFVSQPGMVPYCNTKIAVLSFHEGLQQEIRSVYNAPEVKFTVVHPTFASTPIIAKYEAGLRKGGAQIVEPRMVTDAVVKQVFSGRGRQILVAPQIWWTNTLRSWPHWLSTGIPMVMEVGRRKAGEFEAMRSLDGQK